jgi:chaperonin GroEL (HSP60 family)
MSAITTLNPKAESARQAQALAINISAARGLAEMLKTNLGPKGTMKMYVELYLFELSIHILGLYPVQVILK